MNAKKRKIESDAEAASEADVGICEYVNKDSNGFTGLIKQRYSDFQVNEIGLDGVVVELKELPKTPTKEETSEPTPVVEEEEIVKNKEIEELEQILKTSASNLLELANTANSPKVELSADCSKEERTKIHQLIREGFNGRLESKTDNGKIVVFKLKNKNRNRQRQQQNPRGADYLHFTLYKENKDTMEAVSLISRLLHIPSKAIMFSGTKDRRAATTQKCCWRRGNIARLLGLNLHGNLIISDFEFKSHGLKLGDLKGNQFGIVVRQFNIDQLDAANVALTSLRDNGFINYYGLQRFGTFSVPSHVVGKFILCEDYDSAVKALLSPAKHTLQESLEAREVWANTGDAEKALELMPRRCVAESALLRALGESANTLNAILHIPFNLKTMYVHAYQSFVWNSMASERIKLNNAKPIPGDLVFADSNENESVQRARPITDEEIEQGTKTIFDVVLPTPGFDVEYPANLVSKYEELMQNDKIDCHNMKRKVKEFSLFGSYRHLLAKPMTCEWTLKKYLNDDDTILYTSKEQLEHNTKYAPENGDKHALVITLGLASSQYATMALREAMKQETSRNGNIYYG